MARIELTHEQRRAAETLGGGLLVAAGAGSGKTRVLTERIVNAVSGAGGFHALELTELLAITFTEKAAGELSERVRAALRAAGHSDKARRVDGAWISTIHGMCHRLLRAEAIAAGIDPAFTVIDTVEASRLRLTAFEAAADSLGVDSGVEELLEDFGFDAVASTVFALGQACRNRHRSALELRAEEVPAARALLAETIAGLNQLVTEFSTCEPCAAAQAHGHACKATISELDGLIASNLDDRTVLDAIRDVLHGHSVPRSYKGLNGLEKTHRAFIATMLGRIAGAVAAPYTKPLMRLTDEWAARFTHAKREAGKLDFDDLQLEAARLLRDPRVAKRWADRFRLTMVDEFQDTDALQLELIRALSGPNLCAVGDEQQSIYRFRGADVEVFRRYETDLKKASGPVVQLTANFRSHGAVLAFVNHLFGSEEMFGERLLRLRHARTEPTVPVVSDGAERIELLIAEKTKEISNEETRRAVATQVAVRVKGLLEPGADGISRLAPADVVVLMPTYTHARVYARALLSAGIPAVVVGGSRFFECREVHALRSFCRLIANRSDESALVSVLVSGLCGMSDPGLLRIRSAVEAGLATGLWDALEAADLEADDRCRADALIRAVRLALQRVGRLPLAEVILHAVEDTDFDLTLLRQGEEGREAYANVLKFARMAASFEQGPESGPASFAAYLDAKETYGEHETPASFAAEDGNAVRIMSIHISKGLEFPVVVLPELGEARKGGRGCIARWSVEDDDPKLALHTPPGWAYSKDPQAALYEQIDQMTVKAEEEEQKRLFYVACTRAREALILAGAAPKDGKALTMLGMVRAAFSVGEGEERVPIGEGFFLRVTLVAPPEFACDGATAHDDTEAGHHIEPHDRPSMIVDAEPARRGQTAAWPPVQAPAPRRLSYTALAAFETCAKRFYTERVLGMRLPTSLTASDATRLGNAVHAVLQLFGESESIDSGRLAAIARYHGLDRRLEARLVAAVEAYRSSPIAREVAEYHVVRREAPFSINIDVDGGHFALAGSIDVYATDGTRALIVDYKTGTEDLDDATLRDRYGFQAGCYALAARSDGRPHVDVVFVRPEAPRHGGDVRHVRFTFDNDGLVDLENRIRAAYRQMIEDAYESRTAYDASVCGDCPVSDCQCAVKARHLEHAGREGAA